METNKILILTICVLIYVFLTVFVGKTITKKLRKTAAEEFNFNYYAIVFSGFIFCSGIFGKELFTVLNDAFSILEKNNASNTEFFRTTSVFIISGILMSSIVYYFSFLLIKIIFEKIKIVEQYSSDQFGYFLLFAVFMIVLSLISVPLYHELLVLFSPKIEAGLYN